MNDYKKIFRLLELLIEKKIWKKIDDGKVLGVEMPDTKNKYYASITNVVTPEPGIMIFEGEKGLRNLKAIYGETPMPFDLVPQMQFLGIFFEEDFNFLTPMDQKALKDNPYGDYKGLGYPRFFRKNTGEIDKAMTSEDLAIITVVLEQLVEDSLRKLKSIDPFNEETKITLRKKTGSNWKRVIEKPYFSYEQVQVNEMQVYPLKKKTDKIFEVWHLGLLYHMFPVYSDEGKEELLVYPRGVFILASDETLLEHSIHERAEASIHETKKLIEEAINAAGFRPVKIVTDDEEMFFSFKTYLEALDIEIEYDPYDEVLFELKSLNYEEAYDFEEENSLEIEDLFDTYLESKGFGLEGLDAIEEEHLEELMEDFEEVIKNLTKYLEKGTSDGTLTTETSAVDIKGFFEDILKKDMDPKDKE